MIDVTQKRFFDETDEKKAKRLKSDEDLKSVSNNLTREEIIQKGRASILEKINKMKEAHSEKINSLDKSIKMDFHSVRSDIQKRIQEHKNLINKSAIKARIQDNDIDDDEFRGKGGLSVGVHPSLLTDTSKTGNDKRNKIRPKFATTIVTEFPDFYNF